MQKSTSSRSSASSTASLPRDQLVALPSLANSLSSLPQAKTLDNLALHSSSSAQRNAESEAKLRKVLSKTNSSSAVPPAYLSSSQMPGYGDNSPPLMMRKPVRVLELSIPDLKQKA
ncbi:hypothetical protein EIP91_012184 [Steccherinum ochraceum]|uniref:Uncharacterized protein n=1 Tax=Steccherinum ochraceum TaxID=92696 RepID=A0A4R0RQF6_9APHY|nr:hypothetical protein EIP91_012184 [Steccherinum ochraceum]